MTPTFAERRWTSADGHSLYARDYAPPGSDYAVQRFTKEAGRVYGVLDRRLAEVRGG